MDECKIKDIAQILKEKRIEKNLELKDVHIKTKIPLKFLEAIEEGKLPPMDLVYIKGLLKIYCNFLDLDYYSLIEKAQLKPKEKVEKESAVFLDTKIGIKQERNIFFKGIIIFLIGIIFILGFVIRFKKKLHTPSIKIEERTPATSSLTKNIEWPKEKIDTKTPKIIKVRLQAKQDCWVKAVVDGRVVYQSVLKKGRFESWEAKEKIELSLGNAGGVELYVNEKPFSTLGKSGQVIRKLLINQEGLQVLR